MTRGYPIFRPIPVNSLVSQHGWAESAHMFDEKISWEWMIHVDLSTSKLDLPEDRSVDVPISIQSRPLDRQVGLFHLAAMIIHKPQIA